MARAKLAVLTQSDVKRLEGCIQTLADTDAKFRSKASAVDYIAGQLALSPRIVKEWVRRARPISRRSELQALFFGAYEKIASLLVESLEAALHATANTVGGRDSVKAIMYLLPRVHPERYGDVPDDPDEDDTLVIADVSQEVWDQITQTPELLAELEQLQQTRLAADERVKAIVKEAQSAALQAEIAERAVRH